MALRIGSSTLTTSTTNKERIVLNTLSEPNMVVLRAGASVPSVNITFNDDMIIGRRSNAFFFSSGSSNMMTLSQSSNVSYQPLYVSNTLNVSGNVVLSGPQVTIPNAGNIANISTKSIVVNVGDDTATYLQVKRDTGAPFIQATKENSITLRTAKIGINTEPPGIQDSSNTLNIFGNTNVIGGGVSSAGFVTTPIINAAQPNNLYTHKITLNSTVINPNTRQIEPVIQFDSNIYVPQRIITKELISDILRFTEAAVSAITVSSNANLTSTTCFNTALTNKPTLTLRHNSTVNACNVLDVFIDGSNVGMSLDPLGRISMGSRNSARGMLDIAYNACNMASNMFAISGIDPGDLFFVDNNANIGLGTTLPQHSLHVSRVEDHRTNNAFIGLYDYTVEDPTSNTGYGPFLNAFTASGDCVTYLDKYGSLTLGNTAYDSNWTLNVANSLQSPYIQTNTLRAYPGASCNIDTQFSSFNNVNNIQCSNIVSVGNSVLSNLNTNYIFASNFSIVGLDIFDNRGVNSAFRLLGDRYIFVGRSACFSPSMDDLQTDPVSEGKFKLVTTNLSDASRTSVGVNVVGTSRNSVRVTSSTVPLFELYRQGQSTASPGIGYIGVDSVSGMFISYGNTSVTDATSIYSSKQFQLNDGNIRLCRNVVVSSDARMCINLNDGSSETSTTFLASSATKFLVRGTTRIMDLNNNPLLTVSDANGNVGIGISSGMLAKCHINGGLYQANGANSIYGTTTFYNVATFSSNAVFNNDIIYRGNVLSSSPWLFSGTNAYIIGSNVGIGLSNPQTALHVSGTSLFSNVIASGVGIGTMAPRAAIDVVNSNVIITGSGALGVGTSNPGRLLHVQGMSFFSSNVGIGVSQPTSYILDIGGDINFSGDLYKNRKPYVSSQWTSVPISDTSSNLYFMNNVGVGNSNPQYKLHVSNGDSYFSSNVTVGGILRSSRSVATTSDIRVKENLQRLSDPLHTVSQLSGYQYYRTDVKVNEIGLVAQEVQKVCPELVAEADGMLHISYGNMAAVFVEAIKALTDKVCTLTHKINTLETRLATLNTPQ